MGLFQELYDNISNPIVMLQKISKRIEDLQVTGGQGEAVDDLALPSTDIEIDDPVASDLNAVFSDTEVEAALDAKADHAAVVAALAIAEARVDSLEAKLNELMGSLRASGQIAEE